MLYTTDPVGVINIDGTGKCKCKIVSLSRGIHSVSLSSQGPVHFVHHTHRGCNETWSSKCFFACSYLKKKSFSVAKIIH